MANIDGRVLQVLQSGDTMMAYLYGFGVDRAQLKPEHQRWLSENLVKSILARAFQPKAHLVNTSADPWATPTDKQYDLPERWLVWLLGTTSRTGTATYNLGLSRRRAEAVRDCIDRQLKGAIGSAGINYTIDPHWHGELWAAVHGRKDHWENPLDRAVLISFRPVYANSLPSRLTPPAPIQRPAGVLPCCMKELMIEYYQLVKDAWSFTMTRGGVSAGGGRRTLTWDLEASPDQAWTHSLLHSHGWGGRVNYMLEHGLYMQVRADLAMGITRDIDNDLRNAQSLVCHSSDPDDMCHHSETFSKVYLGPP